MPSINGCSRCWNNSAAPGLTWDIRHPPFLSPSTRLPRCSAERGGFRDLVGPGDIARGAVRALSITSRFSWWQCQPFVGKDFIEPGGFAGQTLITYRVDRANWTCSPICWARRGRAARAAPAELTEISLLLVASEPGRVGAARLGGAAGNGSGPIYVTRRLYRARGHPADVRPSYPQRRCRPALHAHVVRRPGKTALRLQSAA